MTHTVSSGSMTYTGRPRPEEEHSPCVSSCQSASLLVLSGSGSKTVLLLQSLHSSDAVGISLGLLGMSETVLQLIGNLGMRVHASEWKWPADHPQSVRSLMVAEKAGMKGEGR